jgi:predicted nucleotidyltransferase
MKRTEVLAILNTHHAEIQAYGVKSLSLFGSVARDTAQDTSDVDLLVEFSQPTGLFKFIALQQYLESLLQCKVDLGTPKSLKARLKPQVLKEAIHVV